MLKVTENLKTLLQKKNLSENKLAQAIEYHSGSLNKIINGKEAFPEHIIEKIAPILEVSPEEIKGWILADKYAQNILKRALEVKQEVQPEAGKLILTTKIDSFLQLKAISRTSLSKMVGYSQGKLNEMIIGKEPISPNVISKIAPVLDVSEDEINSWIVADKYSVEALRVAVEC